MLFSHEIEDLRDDGFEGSVAEHCIFTEVFFSKDCGGSSKRCLVTGAINFESDFSKQRHVGICSNSQNSALASQKYSCNIKEHSGGKSKLGCFSEGLALSVRNGRDVNSKRMKLSADEPSNAKTYSGKVSNSLAPLKESAFDGPHCAASMFDTVTCRLVESSGEGVTSRCYLLKQQVETERDDMADTDISECKLTNSDGSDWKGVGSSKASASPVSQESCATKLLSTNSSIITANKNASLQHSKPRWKETSFVKLDIEELLLYKDSKKDPRSLLRYHINRFFEAAGWEVGRRKRSNKSHGHGEFVYKSPEGRPIREFYRAWDLCGQSLFDDANCDVQESPKKWADLPQFWSDLSNTYVQIEALLDGLVTTTALAHRWCLLDPFANVVFVDKMIPTLRCGKEVKAKRSLAINSYAKHEALVALKNVNSAEKQAIDWPSDTSLVVNSVPASEGEYFVHKGLFGCGSSEICGHLQGWAVKAQRGLPSYSTVGKCFELNDTMGGVRNIYGKISAKKKRGLELTSFPACGSDSTCDQPTTYQFEGPGHADNSLPELETVSHQDSDTNSQSSNKERFDNNEGKALHGKVRKLGNSFQKFCSPSSASELCRESIMEDNHFACTNNIEFMQHCEHDKEAGLCSETQKIMKIYESSAPNAVFKNNAQKQSRKISEIRIKTLYHDDENGLVNPREAELREPGRNGVQLGSGVLECSLTNIIHDRSSKKVSDCSSWHQNDIKEFRSKEFQQSSGSSKKFVQLSSDCNDLKVPNYGKYVNEAPLDVLNVSRNALTWRHAIKSERNDTEVENQGNKSLTCQLNDDDLLISAVIKNKSFRSTTEKSCPKRSNGRSRSLKKRKSHKGGCRLLPRSLNKGGINFVEGKWSIFASRTVLSWLIHSEVLSLNEVIQYRNPEDDVVVKEGVITQNGILCRCCNEVFSVSAFKTHAGFRLSRPCLNLFMESGKAFTLCQLQAWSAEYKARKSTARTVQVEDIDQNDDSCGLCGDGGELICCDNCPSTFHQACLHAKELPEGNWYCAHCTCRICGIVITDTEVSKSPSAFKCSQCEHKYHDACLKRNGVNRAVASETRFCSGYCQEVYSGLHFRIGVMNLLSDGFSWTLLRCIHGDQKVHSAQRSVALKAECNSKLAVSLTIMEECFLPMVDPRTGIDMIPHVVYNWGSQFARLNYQGFYTVVLEKDDVLISVASLRIHGVTVAEMPLIATCSKHRRQGMCRRLMSSIEDMLKSFKVEKLVISAIPNVVETWTDGFGFKPLEDNEKESLGDINLMVFPGTVWLKKHLMENEVANQQLGVVDPTALSGGAPTTEPVQQSDQDSCVKEADNGGDGETKKHLHVGEEDVLNGRLHEQYSKLPLEEPGLVVSERSQVESVQVYVGRHSLTERTVAENTHLLQDNEI